MGIAALPSMLLEQVVRRVSSNSSTALALLKIKSQVLLVNSRMARIVSMAVSQPPLTASTLRVVSLMARTFLFLALIGFRARKLIETLPVVEAVS